MIKSRNKKGQHYLLSAEARSFSLMQIMRLSDDEAFEMFKDARWPQGVACPCCGGVDQYQIKTRKQWRCKHKECRHTFSVTSGTIFANAKMPLRVYLAAIALYSNCAKGMSALQLSRDLDVQYKTAFVLAHKLRESLQDEQMSLLEGEVEIDAAYFNGHVRPANHIDNRVDRRKKENQDPDKRAVLVARQRGQEGEGAVETIIGVAKSENEDTAVAFAKKFVCRNATITTDEHVSYNALRGHFKVERVNHQENYVGPAGESTNNAESFFSRLRRMHIGQTHKFGNAYLGRYAQEAAHREDTRRQSNGWIFHDVMGRCASARPSRDLCGYWQGNKKMGEDLVRP